MIIKFLLLLLFAAAISRLFTGTKDDEPFDVFDEPDPKDFA
jgi:hypothetical protein